MALTPYHGLNPMPMELMIKIAEKAYAKSYLLATYLQAPRKPVVATLASHELGGHKGLSGDDDSRQLTIHSCVNLIA